ncbi:TPA: hypothetical protein ACSPOR_004661 [Bacillus cereus]|uniref:hypothetical protein n=1 Tax=Bacillus cereus TaxID=1396 RepID=UPI00065BC317|nr:hypothetical protein [Bacillus cereus]KMQ22103.1 hypothetical protein TU58_30025 [Bacillus cereus]
MKRKHPIKHKKHGTLTADAIHREDFKTNEADAKKWAEKKREEIDIHLTTNEKKALDDLKKTEESGGSDNLNDLLRETGGDLDRLPIHDNLGKEDEALKERKEKYQEQQNHIKNALEKSSTKINGRMFVYMPAEVSTISKKLEDFVDKKNPSLINSDVLKTFNYDYGLTSEFLAVTASYKQTYANEDENIRIIFKLELPKGTSVLPAGGDSDTLYIKPGEVVVYDPDDLTVTIMGGKEYIWIDAKYVTPQNEGLDKKDEIAAFQAVANREWFKAVTTPSEYELFQFDFSGLFAGAEVDSIARAFDELIKLEEKFKYSFLGNVTNYMGEEMEDGKIIITDRLLGYVPGMSLGNLTESKLAELNKMNGNTIGVTRKIGINIHSIQEGFDNDINKIQYVIIRELTNMQNYRLGRSDYNHGLFTDYDDAKNGYFKTEIYDREASFFPEPIFHHMKSSKNDYVAGIHAFMYSEQKYSGELASGLPGGKTFSEIVQNRAPKTVAWIKKYMYR